MAITLPSGLKIAAQEAVDNRILLSTEEMLNIKVANIPKPYFCICKDDNKVYIYNPDENLDMKSDIGKFRAVERYLFNTNDTKTLFNELAENKQDKLGVNEENPTTELHSLTIGDIVYKLAGDAKAEQTYITDVTVGHLAAGTQVTADTKLADLLYRILFSPGPVEYPELTDPSITINISKLFTLPSTPYEQSGTVLFSRGSIDPAYGTSGYRVGLPTTCELTDDSTHSTNFNQETLKANFVVSFTSIKPGNNLVHIKVTFGQGEQPKDSNGNNYNIPYPSTTIEEDFIVSGLTASFSKTDISPEEQDIFLEDGVIEDTSDTSRWLTGYFINTNSDKKEGYQIKLTGIEDEGQSQYVYLPTCVSILGIQKWNMLANKWDDINPAIPLENYFVKNPEPITKVVEVEGESLSTQYYEYRYNCEQYDPIDIDYGVRFVVVDPTK